MFISLESDDDSQASDSEGSAASVVLNTPYTSTGIFTETHMVTTSGGRLGAVDQDTRFVTGTPYTSASTGIFTETHMVTTSGGRLGAVDRDARLTTATDLSIDSEEDDHAITDDDVVDDHETGTDDEVSTDIFSGVETSTTVVERTEDGHSGKPVILDLVEDEDTGMFSRITEAIHSRFKRRSENLLDEVDDDTQRLDEPIHAKPVSLHDELMQSKPISLHDELVQAKKPLLLQDELIHARSISSNDEQIHTRPLSSKNESLQLRPISSPFEEETTSFITDEDEDSEEDEMTVSHTQIKRYHFQERFEIEERHTGVGEQRDRSEGRGMLDHRGDTEAVEAELVRLDDADQSVEDASPRVSEASSGSLHKILVIDHEKRAEMSVTHTPAKENIEEIITVKPVGVPPRTGLHLEADKTYKTTETEIQDEVTIHSKVKQTRTVKMELSEVGGVSLEETSQVETETNLQEHRKTIEKEDILITHKVGREMLMDAPPQSPLLSPRSPAPPSFRPNLSRSDTADSDGVITLPEGSISIESDQALYRAICAYEPEADEVLSLHEGENVEVIDDSQEDWWMVRKLFNNRVGWVPGNYLKDKVEYDRMVLEELQNWIAKLPNESSKHSYTIHLYINIHMIITREQHSQTP